MSSEDQEPSVVALEGRIRRRKLRLERMNPVEDFTAYEQRLHELAALEAQLRDRLGAARHSGEG